MGYYIVSIDKTTSMKNLTLISSMKFLSLEVVFDLSKSTIQCCIEYCFHIWVEAPSSYLDMLYKLQKTGTWDYWSPTCHLKKWNVASSSLSYKYHFGRYSSEMAELAPISYSCWSSTRYSSSCMFFCHNSESYKDIYVNSFFPLAGRL